MFQWVLCPEKWYHTLNVYESQSPPYSTDCCGCQLEIIEPEFYLIFHFQSGLCSSSDLATSRGNIRIQHLIHSAGGGTLPHLRSTSSAGGSGSSGHQSLKACRQVSNAGGGGSLPRFPRLQDCAHFHYEFTELGHLSVMFWIKELHPAFEKCQVLRQYDSRWCYNIANF